MSEAFGSTSDPSSQASSATSNRAVGSVLRAIAYLSVAGALTMVGFGAYRMVQDRAVMFETRDHLNEQRGLIQPVKKHLDAEYIDTDGNLLADLPGDQGKLINPDTLVLAHYIDAEVEKQLVDWDALKASLEQATGKTVVLQEYVNTADDVAAVKAGEIQLVALHAADAPYVVNNAGLIPLGVLGTKAGAAHGNRLDIAVPAGSKINALADIRGHKLTCTAPNSMTGYRAAIIVLREQAGLQPDVDYTINFSLGQKRSVHGIANGEFAVAALSDDKVQSMLNRGSVKASDYRVIYQSEVIPQLTIGYVYNLEPTVAERVTAAVFDFQNEGGSGDEVSGEPTRFYPIDYKKDFEFVRTVDDSFDPRFFKAAAAKTKSEEKQRGRASRE